MSSKRRALEIASSLAVRTGLNTLARRPWKGSSAHRVAILAYHDFDPVESEGILSPERLRGHIRFLKRTYHLCTLSDAVDALADAKGLDRDLAVLTFDDGYAGNHEFAWPILRDEGVPATIFLTTGFMDGAPLWFDVARRAQGPAANALLGSALPGWAPAQGIEAALEGMKLLTADARRALIRALEPLSAHRPPARPLSWDQARELAASGIELGGHTVTHPILSALSLAEQEEELRVCFERIHEETGRAPRAFAIPNGSVNDFDSDTLEVARSVGFDSVCTMVRGTNPPGSDPFRLRRIGVGADTESVLATRLSGLLDGLRSDTT